MKIEASQLYAITNNIIHRVSIEHNTKFECLLHNFHLRNAVYMAGDELVSPHAEIRVFHSVRQH